VSDGAPERSPGSRRPTRGTGPELRTRRLLLLPFAPERVPDLHRILTDPEVRRYLLDGQVVPPEWVEAEVRSSRARFREEGLGLWAVTDHRSREVLGLCGFQPFHDPPELQLVCALAPSAWGRGLATEAATEVIRYAFLHAGLERIRADTDAPNRASVRLMERLGMTFVGRSRKSGLETLSYALWR
jgi:[ribosomal protein S5]-alanine N-acetyltransferase